MNKHQGVSASTIVAILALIGLLVFAPNGEASGYAKFTKTEFLVLNACDKRVYSFRHPYKGLVIASPPREWCRWTILALRQPGRPTARYAASPALAKLIRLESGYSPRAANPTSTAFGLYQFLDSTWRSYGCQRTTNPVQQSVCGIRYIQRRYGSPRAAFAAHLKQNWY